MAIMRTFWHLLWFFAAGIAALAARAEAGAESRPAVSATVEPASGVDLRPVFERYGLAPRRQGARPTCSSFTVAGALEFACAARQGHGVRLSAEYLNWAANQACGDREDGGFFSDLWKGFSTRGICAEAEMPYQARFEPDRAPSPGAAADAKTRLALGLEFHWIKEWNVNTGLTPAHEAGIKEALRSGWPVCGGFRWPKQEQWVEGVLQMCPSNSVRDGHSILLVGWRDDAAQPGGGVWLFRNTSGTGRDGAMPFGYAREFMNDAAWIGFQARPKPAASAKPVASPSDVLGSLAAPMAGRSRRVSSNEQPLWNDANLDMTILPPGKAVEMPLLEGPGMITHIWLTSHAGRVNELNALTVRIYWDGRAEPGVEAPLGDFFAVGQGRPAVVESLPVQVSPSGALSCYWRMPFAKSARIVVSNDNSNRTTGLYWQVDWVELDALAPETPYFHASYRQAHPARAGGDYVIADLQGRGHYAGTVMSVTLAQDGWWGEGDDFFQIDGEAVPSLQGTGAEDYFNDAWGFRPRTGHWFGQPRWQGDNAGDSGVCYRWHALDPVRFSRSLKVTLEHKGNRVEDTEGFYLERPDFISSVAFWYQTGQPAPFPPLPSFSERTVPWQSHHLVRAFRHVSATGPARPRVETSGMFGARPVLGWTNTEAGARLTVPFTVAAAGRSALRLDAATAPSYGIYRVDLDGQVLLAAADFRAPEPGEVDLALGTRELAAGAHTLSFVALPGGGASAAPMAVEMLRVLPLPPEAVRTVKTRHEAHFIRLGIGRAVYAFRLANDVLPESLKVLVDAGFLEPRFLADENGKPLRSRREEGFLVVESAAPGGWTYRWEGLDARR